jgi:hypothetical protein
MTKHIALAAVLILSAPAALAQAPAAPAAKAPAATPAPAAKAPAALPAPAAHSGQLEMKNAGVPGVAEATRTVKETLEVVAVDLATRSLTVKDAKGVVDTITVSPKVKRLSEVAAGDKLVIQFKEGLVLELQSPGDAPAATEAAAGGARNPKDKAPGGEVVGAVRATVTVTAIDLPNRAVVLQGPEGKYHQVKAGPSIQLDRLKVGDKLIATYVQAVAIDLHKAPPAKPAKAKEPAAKEAKPAK